MKVTEFVIRVEMQDDGRSAKVSIGATNQDIGALMVATENMMNMMALESNAGYDKALELLVEGAKKAHRVQGRPH
jgi:hypothetical protein